MPCCVLCVYICLRHAPSNEPTLCLVVQVNKDILGRIREAFTKADVDGTGALAKDEFVHAFVGILQTEDGADEVCMCSSWEGGAQDWQLLEACRGHAPAVNVLIGSGWLCRTVVNRGCCCAFCCLQ